MFEITKKYGYNDLGVIVTLTEINEYDEIVAQAVITLREDQRCPSEHGWKEELIRTIKDGGDNAIGEFSLGWIAAIREASSPYYTGGEDPYWMSRS